MKKLVIDLSKYSIYELNMFVTALRREFIKSQEDENAKKVAQDIYEQVSKYLLASGLRSTTGFRDQEELDEQNS